MENIEFVNAGYNVPEFKSLRFHWSLHQHAFLYFQGPALVNGKRVDSGACILYKKGSVHDYVTLKGFVNSYIGFNAPAELFAKLSIKTDNVIYPNNCGEINDILREICRENAERERGWDEEIGALIIMLLVAVSRGTNAGSGRSTEIKDKLTALRAEYLSNPANPADISELMTRCGFSRTSFYRLYQRFFHVSPKEDLIWARLEMARELLRMTPDKKMYEIASECGFNDIPHFFRLFKRRYGYTPKDYAKAAKAERDEQEKKS